MKNYFYKTSLPGSVPVTGLMLFIGRQEGHPARRKFGVGLLVVTI